MPALCEWGCWLKLRCSALILGVEALIVSGERSGVIEVMGLFTRIFPRISS